ncbi:MAG: hypothetical protein E3J72_02590 [Planctomycetota bacterium]|nr:MAG: hypothetical protein E3J72_02590 [Planctomycetota bacterium]
MTFTAEIISRLSFVGTVLLALVVWELGVLFWPARRGVKAIAATVVPGLGHCYAGRPGAGFLYFAVAFTAANSLVLGYTLLFGPAAPFFFWAGFIVLAVTFTLALSGVLLATVGRDPEERALYRENRFRVGLIQFMKGEFASARGTFHELVSWNHRDQDALYYEGVSARHEAQALREKARRHDRAGEKMQAARCRRLATGAWRYALSCYRRCLLVDPHGKWADEITGEIEQVRIVSKPSARLKAVSASEPDFTKNPPGGASPEAAPLIQVTDIATRRERLLDDIRNLQSGRR